MSSKMLVTMKLDQRLAMNQQLRQAIELLQYNTLELRQLVQQQIELNPLIELEESESDIQVESDEFNDNENEQDETYEEQQQYYNNGLKRSSYQSNEFSIENYSQVKTLREHLLEQTLLCHFNPTQQLIAESVIDSIDDDGFLTLQPQEILDSIGNQIQTDLSQINEIIVKIQTFDPAGVCSFNIRDCLLNQLNNYEPKNEIWKLAYHIVSELSHDSSLTHIKKNIKELKDANSSYKKAIDLIKTFNFYPGAQYITNRDLSHEPELYVKKIAGEWHVFLVDSSLTNIKINQQYQELIKHDKKHPSYQSLKRELEEAKWLVSGIKKRNETLLNVANIIVSVQKDFLDYGLEHMKPMNIIDVSTALDLHESTVSRITSGKYISTPRGVFELKYFFPSHVTTQSGDTCSAISVKSLIKELISQETPQHVLTDNDIVTTLKEKGINIARRTVTKYRESMNILSSYQRQMQYAGMETNEECELCL